MTLERLHTSSR